MISCFFIPYPTSKTLNSHLLSKDYHVILQKKGDDQMFEKGSFRPVQSTKLVDNVVNQIQQKISTGIISLGDKLPPEPK